MITVVTDFGFFFCFTGLRKTFFMPVLLLAICLAEQHTWPYVCYSGRLVISSGIQLHVMTQGQIMCLCLHVLFGVLTCFCEDGVGVH